jgi:hypothetical protein
MRRNRTVLARPATMQRAEPDEEEPDCSSPSGDDAEGGAR